MATIGQVAVIVAQAGVDVDGYPAVDQLRRDVPATVVIHQEQGEGLPALGQRVRARIAQLTSQGYRMHSATFLAQRGFGLPDVLGTADLVRAMHSGMLTLGSGQVCLQPAAHDLHAQVALKALADAMSEQVRGTGVEIVSCAAQRPSVPPLAQVTV
jgi:hypothetical protein